eukprot:513650-Amphidinium_carterae.1
MELLSMRYTPRSASGKRSSSSFRFVIMLTTMLTVYVLVGDDLRVYLTDKPMDTYFNIATLRSFCPASARTLMLCTLPRPIRF